MIDRDLFSSDHEAFRREVRRFIDTEIVPYHYDWEEKGEFPRELWNRAGELGMLCCHVPEEYGGPGADWLYNVVVIEEFARAGTSGPGSAFLVQSEIVAPYILKSGSEELKQKWLPGLCSGELIGALGMTEPSGGSDVQAIRTRAVRDGGDYVINGQKIFISNGERCDLIVLVCKTDVEAKGSRGISLILVEKDREGFKFGRQLDKIGQHATDTAELFFEDVRVPVGNLIGEENGGFKVVMGNLVPERLGQAVRATIVCETVIDWTVRYTRERPAFGTTIGGFQNTQFVLADLEARTEAARAYTDLCIQRYSEGRLDATTTAKLKVVSTELQGEVVDKCLQFFGGYGYMREYPVARAFVDARLQRIAGGTIEVMKQIIAKDMMKRN